MQSLIVLYILPVDITIYITVTFEQYNHKQNLLS